MDRKGEQVQILNINPPTDLSIDKILRHIVEMESIVNLTDDQLIDIRVQCNKDLRNAI
jgi:DNA polymerase III delta prime subunit